MSVTFKQVKRVSSQNFNLDKKEAIELVTSNGGKQVYVGRIMGEARDHKEVQSPHGASVALLGFFSGFDRHGEECRAGTCYVPGGFDSALIGALDAGAKSVQFAFDFYAELNTRGDLRYACAPLGEVADPMEAFKKSLPALPSIPVSVQLELSAPDDVPDDVPGTPEETAAKTGKGKK